MYTDEPVNLARLVVGIEAAPNLHYRDPGRANTR
jgi:hypothetical protein